jgi:hypothetical protein
MDETEKQDDGQYEMTIWLLDALKNALETSWYVNMVCLLDS